MSAKRLRLSWRAPHTGRANYVDYEMHTFADCKPPRYIFVVKGGDVRVGQRLSEALSQDRELIKKVKGAPILCVPHGAEFEVYEVES